ncbi:MAG TPA: 3,4-dihydroxy-2-butanone-4-phosphate synthase [Alphaproteobacteria bacterium]|nr:3,4-dihydroxy-2-butanone-4-phosphate synthase [Alphaproteobacteria bacterium]
MRFHSVEEAIADIRAGRMIVLVDDEGSQAGDLVMAAEKVTPEAINFMAMHGRGLICLSLTPERIDQLDLPLMVRHEPDYTGAAFTVSIEAARGVTTGISAADRAMTILTAIDPKSGPEDLVRPGHIFPIRAEKKGILVRAGQTEGSVDLARLAGFTPAGVICEILNEDGTMAHLPELFAFAQQFALKVVGLSHLIRYRLRTEHHIRRVEEANLPTPWGTFRAVTFESCLDGRHHVLLSVGSFAPDDPALVRVHTQCVAGDVFGSGLCSCHAHLLHALRRIGQEGHGAILYLQPQQRPIRLDPQRELPQRDPSPFGGRAAGNPHALDLRDYGIGAQILRTIGLGTLRLMTTNPEKVEMLEQYGLAVVEQIPPEP